MVNTKAASIVAIFACTHAFAVELTRPLVARAHSVNYVSRGTIPALLRSAHQAKAATIARRASCSLGSFACEDGTGCCPFGLPAITTVTSSPTVYTFPSTTITGPLQNGGDAPTTSTSLPTTLPASGGGSSGIIPNGATAIVSSASTVALLASFVVTLVAHY
ncbi:hypothetical protein DXG01_007052 [Tephrocybe rancida]|nr:hypothetical protein DXG01_007052 [Tephrocybe rancida]